MLAKLKMAKIWSKLCWWVVLAIMSLDFLILDLVGFATVYWNLPFENRCG
jgi:hypothetical protein